MYKAAVLSALLIISLQAATTQSIPTYDGEPRTNYVYSGNHYQNFTRWLRGKAQTSDIGGSDKIQLGTDEQLSRTYNGIPRMDYIYVGDQPQKFVQWRKGELSTDNFQDTTDQYEGTASLMRSYCDNCGFPTDVDNDGYYEDVNGDGEFGPADVTLANNLRGELPRKFFDFDEDNDLENAENIGLFDVTALFNELDTGRPIASIRVNNTNPEVGEKVLLNASNPFVGSNYRYRFDTRDADADWEIGYSPDKTVVTSYSTPGEKTVAVEVKNTSDGDRALDTQTITVQDGSSSDECTYYISGEVKGLNTPLSESEKGHIEVEGTDETGQNIGIADDGAIDTRFANQCIGEERTVRYVKNGQVLGVNRTVFFPATDSDVNVIIDTANEGAPSGQDQIISIGKSVENGNRNITASANIFLPYSCYETSNEIEYLSNNRINITFYHNPPSGGAGCAAVTETRRVTANVVDVGLGSSSSKTYQVTASINDSNAEMTKEITFQANNNENAGTQTVEISLERGWNVVSTPGELGIDTFQSNLTQCRIVSGQDDQKTFYTYNSTVGEWKTTGAVRSNEAAYVHINQSCSPEISYEAQESSITLSNGFNLISTNESQTFFPVEGECSDSRFNREVWNISEGTNLGLTAVNGETHSISSTDGVWVERESSGSCNYSPNTQPGTGSSITGNFMSSISSFLWWQ